MKVSYSSAEASPFSDNDPSYGQTALADVAPRRSGPQNLHGTIKVKITGKWAPFFDPAFLEAP